MLLSKKFKGIIQIFRPELPFAAGVCVILGEIIALGYFPSFREVFVGFMCGFFLSGSAIVLNDYFDLEVDRVNAPQRPIPSGMVSPAEAIGLSIISALIGLAACFSISLFALILGSIVWLIGFLYNWKFKQEGLLGNLMVAISVAGTFILGGLVVGEPWNKTVWLFGLTAFFVDLAEEIAGDAMDMEGDRKRDSKSIAIRMGRDAALRISAALFALVVLISFIPYILGWLGETYLLLISLLGLSVLFFTGKLLRSRTPAEGRSSMRGIYLGILFGMLAFMMARFLFEQ